MEVLLEFLDTSKVKPVSELCEKNAFTKKLGFDMWASGPISNSLIGVTICDGIWNRTYTCRTCQSIKAKKLRCLSTGPTYEKNAKYEKGDLV